jgi:hypothetical protein
MIFVAAAEAIGDQKQKSVLMQMAQGYEALAAHTDHLSDQHLSQDDSQDMPSDD